MENQLDLSSSVIKEGYCIGCGVCSVVEDSPFIMELNENGEFVAKAVLNIKESPEITGLCPFSNQSPNEDEIANELFEGRKDSNIGFFQSLYAGHVSKGDYRSKGSSGGTVTWLLGKLLSENEIDAVIHVKDGKSGLYEYGISTTLEEIQDNSKSKYYPVTFSNVLREIDFQKRYAVVGVPCFITSLRLLAKSDLRFKKALKFHISLVCGHFKSEMFTKYIASAMNLDLEEVQNFDYRVKIPNKPANKYGMRATSGKGKETFMQNESIYGLNWGYGLFKYKACDFCDDVMGETADITIGDAWLPKIY